MVIVLCFFFSFCFIFQLAETKSGKAYAILVGVRTSLKFFSAGPVFKTLHVLSSPNLHGCWKWADLTDLDIKSWPDNSDAEGGLGFLKQVPFDDHILSLYRS